MRELRLQAFNIITLTERLQLATKGLRRLLRSGSCLDALIEFGRNANANRYGSDLSELCEITTSTTQAARKARRITYDRDNDRHTSILPALPRGP